MYMFWNDLDLNACVKTTEMLICEKILASSGYKNKIYFKSDGDTFLINISLLNYNALQETYFITFQQLSLNNSMHKSTIFAPGQD